MMYVWQDGLEDELTTNSEIMEYGRTRLFDFDYPLYDDSLKEQFERDFIRHFYTRKIGSETIALFKLRLEDFLYLQYPKWKTMYESLPVDFNPFENVHLETTRNTVEDETQNNTTNTDEQRHEEMGRTLDRDEANQNTVTINGTDTIDGTQVTTEDIDAEDFSRTIDATVPDERLQLTANDGTGLLDYADTIGEVRGTAATDREQNTTTNRTTDRDETQATIGTQTRDDVENRVTNLERGLEELEAKKRDLNRQITETRRGKNTAASYTELYADFIQRFEGIHRGMFREMSYLFLSLLN